MPSQLANNFWNQDYVQTNLLPKQNRWEQAEWDNLTTGSEISSIHMEDIRKRIWLWDYPTAGKNDVKKRYSSWMSWKWANGNSEELLDRQYEDTDGSIVTLGEDEYRWDITNGSAQAGFDITGKCASFHYNGQVIIYDECDIPDPDNPSLTIHIGPFPFASCNGFGGITNSQSLIPPIDRETGQIGNSYFCRYPDTSYYHDWDVNAETHIPGYFRKFPDPEPCSNDNYQTKIASHRWLPVQTDPREQRRPIFCKDRQSYVWQIGEKVEIREKHLNNLPIVTHYIDDPLLSCNLKFQDHTGYDLICTNQGVQGPRSPYISINFSGQSICSLFPMLFPWPFTTAYVLNVSTHPPRDFIATADRYTTAKNESYTELKYDESYWAQIERVLEQNHGTFYPVSGDYIRNWMRKNNQYSDSYKKYPQGGDSVLGGIWDTNTKTNQSDMYTSIDELWGCNTSHEQLVLKQLGPDYYIWELDYNSDTTYQPREIFKIYFELTQCGRDIATIDEEYPFAVFNWKRVPKWSCGRRDWYRQGGQIGLPVLYWPAELGTPPGHTDDDDSRAAITQEQYNAIAANDRNQGVAPWYRDSWYRAVDLNAMFDEYFDKIGYYDEDVDFSQWGITWFDVPNTDDGLQWIEDNYTAGSETLPHPDDPETQINIETWIAYHRHPTIIERETKASGETSYIKRHQKYEVHAEMVKHMRDILRVPQFRQTFPQTQVYEGSAGIYGTVKGYYGLRHTGGPVDLDFYCGDVYLSSGAAASAGIGRLNSIWKAPPDTTEAWLNQTYTGTSPDIITSEYSYIGAGQPRGWFSGWKRYEVDPIHNEGWNGWVLVGKGYDVMGSLYQLCHEDPWEQKRNKFAPNVVWRSDVSVAVKANNLIPDGAILYGRILHFAHQNPMSFEIFGTTVTPAPGGVAGTSFISIGVSNGTGDRWYHVQHLTGWGPSVYSWIRFGYSNDWFYSFDYEVPDSVWERRTVKKYEIDDCNPSAFDDGYPEETHPIIWHDEYDEDQPQFSQEPTLENNSQQ